MATPSLILPLEGGEKPGSHEIVSVASLPRNDTLFPLSVLRFPVFQTATGYKLLATSWFS